jgi:hypothetical protein
MGVLFFSLTILSLSRFNQSFPPTHATTPKHGKASAQLKLPQACIMIIRIITLHISPLSDDFGCLSRRQKEALGLDWF